MFSRWPSDSSGKMSEADSLARGKEALADFCFAGASLSHERYRVRRDERASFSKTNFVALL
jgi:hypothetical protein